MILTTNAQQSYQEDYINNNNGFILKKTSNQMSIMNHSRHHSLNSINLSQFTTMTLHEPIVSSTLSLSSSNSNVHLSQNGQLFQNFNSHHLESSMQSSININVRQNGDIKWKQLDSELIAIAIYNFHEGIPGFSKKFNAKHYLSLFIGDVVVISEECSGWFLGYLESDPVRVGIFPASYVQIFDDHRKNRHSNNDNSMVFYYYTLLDPLYLQVVRTLREWQYYLVQNYYRNNVNMEKFFIVRNLIYELFELCSTLSKDLAPTLWRRRSNQLLKINNDPKDPFAKIYLGEENNSQDDDKGEHSAASFAFDSSLEDLYDRILLKVNQGNQHLNLDIMPSFTHGALNNYQKNLNTLHSTIRSLQVFNKCIVTPNHNDSLLKKRNKFQPYYAKENSKYLPFILDYYNHINRGFNQKFKPNITATAINHRHSFSSFVTSNLLHQSANTANTQNTSLIRKYRRHLLFLIREANFSNLTSDSDQSLHIEAYILRCNDSSGFTSDCPSYEVLTEKYCYRISPNGQTNIQYNKSNVNVNRALYLDVLSKRSPQNGLSTGHHLQSQNSDVSNYYLIIQVWRCGKMLLNEKAKNNAANSLATGSSVFHTLSTSGISSAAVAATSTSLSSITSFVSNSSLFNNNTQTEKSNSSGTPDSSSIDSSEFGSPHFKRSVGFAVIPLLELVSRDKEIRPSLELLQNESCLSKILFSEESMLLSVTVKLYEGDLTVAVLESMLKHRQTSAMSNVSSQSSTLISKLSPLPANCYQLVVCAKFISELIIQNQTNGGIMKNKFSSNSQLDTGNCYKMSPPPLSLADHLLLNQNLLVNDAITTNFGNFVLVQKRCFGDLITSGYFRNDFYLTLDGAEFEKGGKTISKNIEVSVCLITENGIQERALSSGVNSEPVTIYRSHIQYHQNSPKWFEHLKVNVPLEQFETAHLRFVFCHCSSKERERKFLGFSFLPLADNNGACLLDGEHELYIYKCDSERKLDDVSFYLNVPWGQNEKIFGANNNTSNNSIVQSSISSSNISISSSTNANSLINSRSPKEVFHIKTALISSKLTQNADILSLLKWSCTPLEQVYDSLQRIGRVPGEEMVKFLEDILDALFALFTTSLSLFSNQHSDCSTTVTKHSQALIFRVIVDFFKTLNDPKFISYRASLEKYIEKQFSAPLVYSGLIVWVKKYIEVVIISVQQNETGTLSGVTKRELEFILRCLSVFDWILKIIVQSRILYNRASTSENIVMNKSLPSNDNNAIEIQTDIQFKDELILLFTSISRLLMVECKSSDDYLIIAIQESVLNSLPNAFGYLSQILQPIELAKLVQSLVNFTDTVVSNTNRLSTSSECFSPVSSSSITPTNSTPTTTTSFNSTKKTIINAKLTLLQQSIQFQYIWSDEEARLELLDNFIRLLNICLSESKLCLYILRDIIIYLIDNTAGDCCKVRLKHPPHVCEREIEMLSFGTIDVLVEQIIELTGVVPTSFDLVPPFNSHATGALKMNLSEDTDYLGTMIICLMLLLDFMTLKHYEKLFEKRSTSQCKELMLNIFAVFLNALYYFPDNWLEIKMATNRIMLHSLTMLRNTMSQKFLTPDCFDETIWKMYFKLAIAFLTQHRLQLESNFTKRRFILDVYGCDMRISMGFELIACWDLIGPFKISFIPGLVSSFVDVTLVPELKLRKATIPIFYDMLMVDFIANSNFKQVEAALVDKLDVVAHKTECDINFKLLFTQILTEKITNDKPIWANEGLKLVQSLSRLLSLLIDYRNELKRKQNFVKPICEIDDRLLICTYTLLSFFRDDIESTNRKVIMLRYLDKLANIHTMLGNFAEAAFTLKLQSDQLSWSLNDSQKKESICQTMLTFFEKGQCWEEGIKVCKELQRVYECSYKYSKLSLMLKCNADFLDKILTQHRSDNEYFRVSFYGLDFPSFLQNSTFIFRGLEFEKISSFTHRIQQQFPNAQLLTKVVPSDENITESKCQYIQIFSVKPVPDPPLLPEETLQFGSPDNNVFNYYNTNSVKEFIQDRPIQRGPFDPNNEFKSLWIERTTFITEQQLPGMLRMFKAISKVVSYLSPIENACETIENKNSELSKLIAMYNNEKNRPESISPLSMRLQGILDAAVNGGIAKYIDAFLGSEFLLANSDQVANVSRLKERIANQIHLVEVGLSLHGRLAPVAVRPLHTRLLERFSTMRNTVHQANIESSQALLWTPNQIIHRPSILSQPLPPIPQRSDALSDPDSSSLSSTSSCQAINMINNEIRLRTPPPPHSSSTIVIHSNYNHSPINKCHLKNKPLPPLPTSAKNQTNSTLIKRHNSNIETTTNNRFPMKTKLEMDSIYSVPQYTDLDLNLLPDNESSVDDSIDYCDIQNTEPTNNDNNANNNRINRSLSIPSSAMLLYNGCKSEENNAQKISTWEDSSPPPLPPRAISTLDRSNSLNSGSIRPALVAPALPERPVKNKISTTKSSTIIVPNKEFSDEISLPPPSQPAPAPPNLHFAAIDGLEFENLVLSSPTPISSQSSRPAPIIGIEINDNSIMSTVSAAGSMTNSVSEQRAKSSSLPRGLQELTNGINNLEFEPENEINKSSLLD